ncbi:MAG: PQQ-dependent sugar dehydrogenase, partial [Actinobacteria bacterium]|nr:PQQ-dependent sugar dehydrogenase [Actinomycetota bacterium]
GRNYGWGSSYACGTAGVGPNPKRPLKRWSNVIAVTDPWFYKGRMGRLSGDIYAGGFSDGKLHRLMLNRKGTRVKKDRAILGGAGPIVDVSKGPKGWLYYMTPSGIFRIVPRR